VHTLSLLRPDDAFVNILSLITVLKTLNSKLAKSEGRKKESFVASTASAANYYNVKAQV
jgi:hypothetical protein